MAEKEIEISQQNAAAEAVPQNKKAAAQSTALYQKVSIPKKSAQKPQDAVIRQPVKHRTAKPAAQNTQNTQNVQNVKSGITRSTPSISSLGNAMPQSTIIMSLPHS